MAAEAAEYRRVFDKLFYSAASKQRKAAITNGEASTSPVSR